MDRVAYNFRERVAAFWKCCESCSCNQDCVGSSVPDCDWTMKSKKQWTQIFISYNKGTWKHCFINRDWKEEKKLMSMDELLKYPKLKHVTIRNIILAGVTRWDVHEVTMLPSATKREDVERLMKVVGFLSNEPELNLCADSVEMVQSPEGVIVFDYLTKMEFSHVFVCDYIPVPVYNQIVENQFSRRKPTGLVVEEFGLDSVIAGCDQFIAGNLGNGNITRFQGPDNFYFPPKLLERLIENLLKNPENYQHQINARFISAGNVLDRKLKDGECTELSEGNYLFIVYNPKSKKKHYFLVQYDEKSCHVLLALCVGSVYTWIVTELGL